MTTYTVEISKGDMSKVFSGRPTHFTKGWRAPFRFTSSEGGWTFILWEEGGQLVGTTLVGEETFRPHVGECGVLLMPSISEEIIIKITGYYRTR